MAGWSEDYKAGYQAGYKTAQKGCAALTIPRGRQLCDCQPGNCADRLYPLPEKEQAEMEALNGRCRLLARAALTPPSHTSNEE